MMIARTLMIIEVGEVRFKLDWRDMWGSLDKFIIHRLSYSSGVAIVAMRLSIVDEDA